MKLLLLASLFASLNANASGCFPHDVYLASETVLTTLPDAFEGSLNCYEKGECSMYAYNDRPNEWREFYYLTSTGAQTIAPTKTYKKLELKVYRQFFVSSCTELYRIVIGVDVDGKRFRSEKDLDYL